MSPGLHAALWATALRSNALLAFRATSLSAPPALQAVVRVGSAPVGLALIDNGHIALVANSNRGLVPGNIADLQPCGVGVAEHMDVGLDPCLGCEPLDQFVLRLVTHG
jgi:hypothetical protein